MMAMEGTPMPCWNRQQTRRHARRPWAPGWERGGRSSGTGGLGDSGTASHAALSCPTPARLAHAEDRAAG